MRICGDLQPKINMKLHISLLAVVVPLALNAQPASSSIDAPILKQDRVVTADAHERTWQNVSVDAQGVTNISSYTEIATGLNFWNEATGQWEAEDR